MRAIAICALISIAAATVAPARLYIDAWRVGYLENQNGSFMYWTVEFRGEDKDGNIHQWREQITLPGDSTRFDAMLAGHYQFIEKLESGHELALGFLAAIRTDEITR